MCCYIFVQHTITATTMIVVLLYTSYAWYQHTVLMFSKDARQMCVRVHYTSAATMLAHSSGAWP